jgi:hypothetical protein
VFFDAVGTTAGYLLRLGLLGCVRLRRWGGGGNIGGWCDFVGGGAGLFAEKVVFLYVVRGAEGRLGWVEVVGGGWDSTLFLGRFDWGRAAL